MIHYSPLCDTDLSAYLAYLCASVNHGSHTERFGGVDGTAGFQGCGGVCRDAFERLPRMVAHAFGAREDLLGHGVGCRDDVEFDGGVGRGDNSSGAHVPGGVPGGRLVHGDCCRGRSSDGDGGKTYGLDDASDSRFPHGRCPSSLSAAYRDHSWERYDVRGQNWERNQRWKKEKKRKKKARAEAEAHRGYFADCDDEVRARLRDSRARQMCAKNEYETEQFSRKLAVLKANDVDGEIRRYRTGVTAATERNMVSIEKTHGRLRAAGNVPAGGAGSVETVVSAEGVTLGGSSITPDSSVSMAEVWATRKKCSDLEEKYEAAVGLLKRVGLSAEHAALYDKQEWTDNGENAETLQEMYPDGYACLYDYSPDGKFRIIT